MKLTNKEAIKIAEKYNFVYDEDMNEIIIPSQFKIDDDDWSFMRFVDDDGTPYTCAVEFGMTALKDGTFTYHTSTFKNITTVEELEFYLKNFLSFVETIKPLEKKYKEQIKLNSMTGDFQ